MSLHRPRLHYHGNVESMALAQSRLTAQGQISVPAEVRRKLGIGPGSVLEWDEEGGKIVVRRVGRYTSEEIHKALFPNGPPAPRTIEEMDEGIREYMRKTACTPLTPTSSSASSRATSRDRSVRQRPSSSGGTWISHLVLAEAIWVLAANYRLDAL